MLLEQRQWTSRHGWVLQRSNPGFTDPQLVLTFGALEALGGSTLTELREMYPNAHIMGCSTAGEICDTSVRDGTVVATAVRFEHTRVQVARAPLREASASAPVGEALARQLAPEGLKHVFVLAEGLRVNGSELVAGLRRGLPAHVAVTGGLAGDGDRFQETAVWLDDAPLGNLVAVVGFYGERLRVGYGSMGGWDQFGPERLITRSLGNVLYELDGQPALDLYKQYLGAHAANLPASGLLFPLSLRADDGGTGVVRTILAVDEAERSLTFAGDLPQGAHARLMKANFDRLIDGSTTAASLSRAVTGGAAPQLAILISCVGRKLVLGQRVDEEVDSARDILGAEACMAGFYSYGEIAPFTSDSPCELHNQTMTITTFSEN